jgi:hypothetical protein
MIIENSNFRLKEIPNYHPELEYYDRLAFWRNVSVLKDIGFQENGCLVLFIIT